MMQFMKYSIFIFISIHHASSETGCLFDTRICKTNELCFDDGFIGSCHDVYDVITFIQSQNVPVTQYKSMSRRNINPDSFYQTKSSQLKESLTDSAESALGRELRKLLSKSGTRAHDLGTSEQLELARLILNDHYGGGGRYRASKKDAGWLMRLVATISRVRDNLHDQHVTIAQLTDRQLRFLSLAVAKSFLRHEQEREDARSEAEQASEEEVPADSNPVVEDVEVPTPADAQQQQQPAAAASIDGHAPTIVGSKQRVPKVEKNVPATDPPKAGRSAAAAAVPPVVAPPENIHPTTSPVRHSKQANIPPTKLKKVDGAGADNDVLVVVGIVASVAALVIIVTVGLTIYCMRRGAQGGGGKLFRGNPSDDDYQELCRQRYASKATEQRSASQDSTQPLINKHNQFAAGSTMKRVFSPGGSSGGSKRGPAESRLQRLSSVASNSSAGSWSEEPVTTSLDISTGHAILSYMEDHLRNHERLDEEWTALCSYTADDESFAVARANCSKNRSDLVLPYDDNRVVIEKSENPMESDYINASLIIDNDPKAPLYIAAQGPLPSTIHQFWQMIWEQGSVAIVMLTPTVEEAALQCARYWPDEGSVNYNNFEIHLVSEHIWCEDYLVRSLYLKNLASGETRTLTQFHFLSWPHNGIPPSPKPLLELRRKVVKCYRGTNTPVVVHCSNGAGRTGTYILIDLVINRMLKGAKEMDIAATLEHLRDQRHGLVDSKDQLRFALSCVAEEVNAILKLALVKKQPEPSL